MKQSLASKSNCLGTEHRVWDRFLRLFHWALAASVTIGLFGGFLLDASWVLLHLLVGGLATVLVIARIIWGFTGPTYARFSQFLPRPHEITAHLNGSGIHARHIGHNPLAALMVVALLFSVLGLAVTGTGLLGSALKTGPLAFALPATQGWLWSGLHEFLAYSMLGLVALHIGGVAFESRRSQENLARSMFNGRKAMREGDLVAKDQPARIGVSFVLFVGISIGMVVVIISLSRKVPARQPVVAMSAVYLDECAACHMVYHPLLRTDVSWSLMMGQLESHFGEDASLPFDTRVEITDWLSQHAADSVDSKAATLWRDLSEVSPVALPDTVPWQRLHSGLNDSVYQHPSVYSRSNCSACHRDAESGWFSPFNISIPKEDQS